jgi:hypothetical protein
VRELVAGMEPIYERVPTRKVKVRVMTQLEQAKAVIQTLLVWDQAYRKLNNILDKSQNGPPEGTADGSIDENTWLAIRDFADVLFGHNLALKCVKTRLDLPPVGPHR